MTEQFIEHKGNKYDIKEPTIKGWSSIIQLKDILDEEEMNIRMLIEVTGMNREEILSTDVKTIKTISNQLFNYLNQESKELFQRFSFKDKSYKIIDINKITFGQFVDIDSFLQKDEQYRLKNLNELAAYLYSEEGMDYGKTDIKARIKSFEDLPIKYIEGALFFLSILGKTLHEALQIYSQNKWKYRTLRVGTLLAGIGAGMRQLANLPKTRFGKLIMWLLSPLSLVLIISLILWTTIGKKKKEIIINKK